MERFFKSGIFKSDVSDHLPVIFLIPSVKLLNEDEISDTFTKDLYLHWKLKRFWNETFMGFLRQSTRQER